MSRRPPRGRDKYFDADLVELVVGLFASAARAEDRKAGLEIRSVVLAQDASLEVPKFVPCGKKPLAVVLDIDETALLDAVFTGRAQMNDDVGAFTGDPLALIGANEPVSAARAALGTTKLNIRADVAGTVKSVRWGFNGDLSYRTENEAPWALFGDVDGDYRSWSPAAGVYTVSATAFGLASARQQDARSSAEIPVPPSGL